MAQGQEDIWIKLKTMFDGAGTNKLKMELAKVQAENKKLDALASSFHKKNTAAWKDIRRDIGRANAQLKGFQMQWLSVMFFGMAMQRVFGGLLRASFATWSTVTEGTTKAGGAMTQLQAAWEFFKFSLFDALVSSGIFETFVNWVLKLVEWWGDLSEEAKAFVAQVILAAAAIGTVLFAAGTIKLGLQGVSTVLKDAEGVKTGIQGIIGTIAIGYALYQAAEAFDDFKEGKFIDGLLNTLSAGLTGIGGIRLLKGKKGGGALIAIGVAFELLEQRVFFSTIYSFFGILGGIAGAMFGAIGKNAGAVFVNAIIGAVDRALLAIELMLRSNPLTAALGLGVNAMRKNVSNQKQSMDWSFDMGEFAKFYSGAVEYGKLVDEQFNTAVERAQANTIARQQGNASFPGVVNIGNTDEMARKIAYYTPYSPDASYGRTTNDANREGFGYYTPA